MLSILTEKHQNSVAYKMAYAQNRRFVWHAFYFDWNEFDGRHSGWSIEMFLQKKTNFPLGFFLAKRHTLRITRVKENEKWKGRQRRMHVLYKTYSHENPCLEIVLLSTTMPKLMRQPVAQKTILPFRIIRIVFFGESLSEKAT